ncbi:hypothetical protein AB6D20_027710 (plasmid) [Vibrio splendidus]
MTLQTWHDTHPLGEKQTYPLGEKQTSEFCHPEFCHRQYRASIDKESNTM